MPKKPTFQAEHPLLFWLAVAVVAWFFLAQPVGWLLVALFSIIAIPAMIAVIAWIIFR